MEVSFVCDLFLVPQQFAASQASIASDHVEVLVEAEYQRGSIVDLEVWLDDQRITASLGEKILDDLADRALYRALRHAE